MTFKAVIFDLDGTLLNTLEDIADAANRVLQKQGFPVHDSAAFRHFVGDGVRALITRILPEEKRHPATIHAFVNEFRRIYSRHWDQKTKPYEGIADLLNQLTRKRIALAVLSNKPDDFTKKCVNKFFSQRHFEVVMGDQKDVQRKPDPQGALKISDALNLPPEQILYLGDSDVDMKTALSAGMFPVGALWGYRSMNELIENGAQKVISHPAELLTLL